jgi:hypothetical protein
MLPDARVRSVKQRPFAARLPTGRELERWLTQDAGLSRSEARAVMRDGLKGLDDRRDAAIEPHHVTRLDERLGSLVRGLLNSAQQNRTF